MCDFSDKNVNGILSTHLLTTLIMTSVLFLYHYGGPHLIPIRDIYFSFIYTHQSIVDPAEKIFSRSCTPLKTGRERAGVLDDSEPVASMENMPQ